ncbi:MAG TPA: ABC transporter permease subunit [Fimbriimonas sp.]
MSELFKDLVLENPMLIEIQRFKRKFLSAGGSPAVTAISLALAGLCYLGLLILVVSNLGDLPPVALVMVQLGLFTLFAPALLYGAIAGEREKRTWDLLVVAPITKSQIVAGKFVGALAALGAASLLFLLPIVLTALTYKNASHGVASALLAEVLSVAFVAMLCSFTLYVSARVERPLTALGVVLGVLAGVLVVVPTLSSLLVRRVSDDLIALFHPFYAVAKIGAEPHTMPPYATTSGFGWFAWPQIFGYLLATALFLAMTALALQRADAIREAPDHA